MSKTNKFVSDLIKEILQQDDQIKKLAEELVEEKSILLMGRGFNFATCLEGALVRKQQTLKGGQTGLIVLT